MIIDLHQINICILEYQTLTEYLIESLLYAKKTTNVRISQTCIKIKTGNCTMKLNGDKLWIEAGMRVRIVKERDRGKFITVR